VTASHSSLKLPVWILQRLNPLFNAARAFPWIIKDRSRLISCFTITPHPRRIRIYDHPPTMANRFRRVRDQFLEPRAVVHLYPIAIRPLHLALSADHTHHLLRRQSPFVVHFAVPVPPPHLPPPLLPPSTSPSQTLPPIAEFSFPPPPHPVGALLSIDPLCTVNSSDGRSASPTAGGRSAGPRPPPPQ
jgi:hypothetical protein